MQFKLIEIRDRGTFIPAMAVALGYDVEAERYLLRRAGFAQEQLLFKNHHLSDGREEGYIEPYIVLVKLVDFEAQYDPFQWQNRRTMTTAHLYIRDKWFELKTGDVVDVEHVLGEKDRPKISERFTAPV